MKNRFLPLLAATLLCLSAGCYTMKHTVGTGATTGVEEEERAWYILWGLVPLHEVDGGELAGGASNYTIETEFTAVDILIGIFTGLVTIFPQTVTVER